MTLQKGFQQCWKIFGDPNSFQDNFYKTAITLAMQQEFDKTAGFSHLHKQRKYGRTLLHVDVRPVPSFRMPLGARESCRLVQYSSQGGPWTSSIGTTWYLIRHEFSGPPTELLNQNLEVGVRNRRLLRMKLKNFASIVFMWLQFSVFGNTVPIMSRGKSSSIAELYHRAFFHDGRF